MKQDYQTIIRNGLHAELAGWMLAKKKQPLSNARRMSGKPRMRLSRILTDDAKEILTLVLGAIVIGGLLLLALSPYVDNILSWI